MVRHVIKNKNHMYVYIEIINWLLTIFRFIIYEKPNVFLFIYLFLIECPFKRTLCVFLVWFDKYRETSAASQIRWLEFANVFTQFARVGVPLCGLVGTCATLYT